jgi:hypothetical protein
MNILDHFEDFRFSILPCDMQTARQGIRAQSAIWGRSINERDTVVRDIRPIYLSVDGPEHLPAIHVGILLSGVGQGKNAKTLFVSSVADGYASMVMMLSAKIPGIFVSIRVSKSDTPYPCNELSARSNGKWIRTARALLDSGGWEFFQEGDPLPFEDVSHYSARMKKKRVTPEIIEEYLTRYGYGTLDADYWLTAPARSMLLWDPGFRLWTAD